MGRHEEAIAEAERALELDPLSLIIHTTVGDVFFYARQYDRAIEYYRRCMQLDPACGPAHSDVARALEHVGRYDDAIAELQQGTVREGRPVPTAALATLQARAGRPDEARATLGAALSGAGSHVVSAWGVASYYVVTGDRMRALAWLERAYEQLDAALVWTKVHPRVDDLRGEPRFVDLLARMRLDT